MDAEHISSGIDQWRSWISSVSVTRVEKSLTSACVVPVRTLHRCVLSSSGLVSGVTRYLWFAGIYIVTMKAREEWKITYYVTYSLARWIGSNLNDGKVVSDIARIAKFVVYRNITSRPLPVAIHRWSITVISAGCNPSGSVEGFISEVVYTMSSSQDCIGSNNGSRTSTLWIIAVEEQQRMKWENSSTSLEQEWKQRGIRHSSEFATKERTNDLF